MAQSLRRYARDPHEPIIQELNPIRIEGHDVAIHMVIRRAEDGIWRARMVFRKAESKHDLETAEIFRGVSEQDLWESVGHLREHHLRDLFRSLDEAS